MNLPATHITVYASLTPPSVDVDVRYVTRLHRQRGLLSCGYHFVIKRDGTVEEGRPVTVVGAHAEGDNRFNLGILMAGGLDETGAPAPHQFTAAQILAMSRLTSELQDANPGSRVVFDKDYPGAPQ